MHISKIIMKPILRPPTDISSSHADNANTGGVSCIAELREQNRPSRIVRCVARLHEKLQVSDNHMR